MRKNRLLSLFLQCFSAKQRGSKPYDLGGFHFDLEGRDMLAKPMLANTEIDTSFLGTKCLNLLGNGQRGGQSRRLNPKEVC